jgi:hypothetical protein
MTFWRSECVKEWNGLLVYKDFVDPRHPQDLIRARRENLSIPDARPQRRIEDERSVGPLITEVIEGDEDVVAGGGIERASIHSIVTMGYGDGIGSPGAVTTAGYNTVGVQPNIPGSIFLALPVTSTNRMQAGDRIGVYLDVGDLHMTSISEIIGAQLIVIAAALPDRASPGNKVINYDRTAS